MDNRDFVGNFEYNFILSEEVFRKIFPDVDKITDPIWLISLFGMLADAWSAKHNVSTEEMNELLAGLVESHKTINESLGEIDVSEF